MNFTGKNLKYLIRQLAISQATIEPVVGKKQQTISNWVAEKTQMDAEDLVRLSDHFGISLEDFCLNDLSAGNLINEAYISKYRLKGNLKGNLSGNLNTHFHKNIGEPGGEGIPEGMGAEAGLWVVVKLLQQMDGKLDQLRVDINSKGQQ